MIANEVATFMCVPADVVAPAGELQCQAVGLLLVFIGARGHDGLTPTLGAGQLVPWRARAVQHAVAVAGRHLVEKLTQRLVALALVAYFSCGDAAGARADVGGAVLLTRVIQVARLGCIEAVILLGQSRVTLRREKKSIRGHMLVFGYHMGSSNFLFFSYTAFHTLNIPQTFPIKAIFEIWHKHD